MPIDYSKWDNLSLSDDSDEETYTAVSVTRPDITASAKKQVVSNKVNSWAPSTSTKLPLSASSGHRSTKTKDSSNKLVLSLEICFHIFHYNSHPIHLWMQGRQVNHTCHKWVPKIFVEKYLMNPTMMTIRYQLATVCIGGSGKLAELSPVMSLDCYIPRNRNRCIFKQDKTYLRRDPARGAQDMRYDSWEHCNREYLGNVITSDGDLFATESGRPDLPPCITMLKARANDTELPSITVNEKKRELSFLWPRTFHNFFSEAQEHEGRNVKVMVKQMDLLMRAKQRGVTAKQERKLAMNVYVTNIDVRRDVRQERVARLLKVKDRKLELDVIERWFKQREPQALEFLAEQEAAADLVLCAEDAAQLEEAVKLQGKLPKVSEDAEQDALEARIFGVMPNFHAMIEE